MAVVTYKNYKDRLDKLLIKDEDSGEYGKVWDQRIKDWITIPYKEKWVQCYDKDDPVRSDYPKYIFVSDGGNLVSTENENKPTLLKPSITSNNRESYGFSVKTNYKNKAGKKSRKRSQISYIWVSVCFGSDTFGKADEIMSEEGLKAFSKRLLNVHHINGFVQGDQNEKRASNNDPETLEILTPYIHKLFDIAPKPGSSFEDEISFMQELGKRTKAETDQIVYFEPIYDEKKDVTTGHIQELLKDINRFTRFEVGDEWIILPTGKKTFEAIKAMSPEEQSALEQFLVQHSSHIEHGNVGFIYSDLPKIEHGYISQYIVIRK